MNVILAALLTLPLWSTAVDSRISGEWMAESPGRAYVNRDAHVSAIDVNSGRQIWSAGVAAIAAPAYLNDTLAVPTATGISFLDARTGRERSHYALDAQSSVAAATSGFVVVKYGRRSVNAAFGFAGDGTLRWRSVLPVTGNMSAAALGGDAIGVRDWERNVYTVLNASSGRTIASLKDVNDIVGGAPQFLWFTIADGGLEGIDLSSGARVVQHGHVIAKAVSVEDNKAVAVIDGRLQVLDVLNNTVHPLKIAGRWIGGPIDGAILIESGGSLWAPSIEAGARRVRIAKYTGASAFVTSDHHFAFVGLHDGTVLTVDMRVKRLVQQVATSCRIYEGFTASGARTLVHCDKDARHSQVLAFRRAYTP